MKKICLLLTTFFVFFLANSQAQQDPDKMKSVFIYNFTKYIEWPASYRSGNFVIGVLGKTRVTAYLKQMAKTKRAGNQRIVVKEFSSTDAITRSHIIYIPAKESNKLGAVNAKTNQYSTLVVTEMPGLITKGSTINFQVIAQGSSNKLGFELNNNHARQRKLTVSKSLERLAIKVY